MLQEIQPLIYGNLPVLYKIKILLARRLLHIIALQMSSAHPSSHSHFTSSRSSALCVPGSLHSVPRGLGSSVPVIGVVGTDGTFGGLADCSGRDCLLYVKYGQGTAHPSASSRQCWPPAPLASKAEKWLAGARLYFTRPSPLPLSSVNSGLLDGGFPSQIPLLFSLAKAPLPLIMTPNNIELTAWH